MSESQGLLNVVAESTETYSARSKTESIEVLSPEHNEKPTFTLDQLLEKIGFNSYHVKRFLPPALVALMDGAIIMTFSLSTVMLKKQWHYSSELQSLIASLVFVALVIGAYVSGPIADKFGRRLPMLISLGFIIVLNLLSAFSPSVVFYTVTRSMLAFCAGFYSPIGFTYVLEIMPPAQRGKVITLGSACLFMGQLFACLLGLLTLQSLDKGDWRLLTIYSTLPAVVSMIMSFFYLDESMRYLLIKGKVEEAFELLSKSAKNSRHPDMRKLNRDHKESLKKWTAFQPTSQSQEEVSSIRKLFENGFSRITLILWFSWFVHSFCYFGLTLFFPYILNKITTNEEHDMSAHEKLKFNVHPDNLGSLTVSVALESISVVIAFFIIDLKSFGRKRALAFFYTLAAIIAICGFCDRSRMDFIIWSTVFKIVLNICSFYNYLMTLEIYPTRYRATGVGAATAVGKAGSIVMPWVCAFLLEFDTYGPFIGFCVLNLGAAALTMRLPYDTANKEMK